LDDDTNVISELRAVTYFWHPPGAVAIAKAGENEDLYFTIDSGRTFTVAKFAPAPDNEFIPVDPERPVATPVFAFVAEDGSVWVVTINDRFHFDIHADLDPKTTAVFTHVLADPVFSDYGVDLVDVSSGYDGGILIANKYISRRSTYYQTFASWNRGADWSLLTPPPGSCPSGVPLSECALHFEGPALGTHIYSTYTAPGLVIANGNVGPYFNISDANAYISKDGGAFSTFNLIANYA